MIGRQRTRLLSAGLLAGLCLQPHAAVAQGNDDPGNLEEIEVVGTPIGGGVDPQTLPINVQSADAQALNKALALELSEYLNRHFAGVFVNEGQSNPLQNDVQFRGFVASPLLGLPQGLAIYQDGVRVNEVFGDTVNWALVPEGAIATVDLVPGSNPVFGLNALGGAISMRTKNGFSDAGQSLQVSAGSFSRVVLDAESGGTLGANERFSYYVGGSYFDEDGWRDFSPSQTIRLFGNLGWRGEQSNADLSLTQVSTDLIGNGAAPVQLLAQERSAVFTRPDRSENEMSMLSLRGDFHPREKVALDWNVYYRKSDIDTLNGDDSDFGECESPENAGFICLEEDDDDDEEEVQFRAARLEPSAGTDTDPLTGEDVGEDEEEPVLDAAGNPIPANAQSIGATINRSQTRQDAYGATVQFTLDSELSGDRANRLLLGANLNIGEVGFDASTELGALDDTRLAVPAGFLVGDAFTSLDTQVSTLSLYLMNSYTVGERIALTLSGQYNSTDVELRDQLGTALNGDHKFERFNPSAGLTWRLNSRAQVYAGYAESNRAPSPVELTCADPEDPCRLPNAFLADPPLEQVVAKTYELGLRGAHRWFDWHLGLFSTRSEDDIIFISAGAATNQGFFDNVGDTKRYGIDLSFRGALGEQGNWFVNISTLTAQFDENFSVSSPNHPLGEDGEIDVSRGDRLPGVPEVLAKAGFDLPLNHRWSIGADMQYSGDRILRADEANLLSPVGSFAVLNLRGEYRFKENASVFASVQNALDRDYETFGLLGEAAEVLGEGFDNNRFISPGAPRAAWIGVRVAR